MLRNHVFRFMTFEFDVNYHRFSPIFRPSQRLIDGRSVLVNYTLLHQLMVNPLSAVNRMTFEKRDYHIAISIVRYIWLKQALLSVSVKH